MRACEWQRFAICVGKVRTWPQWCEQRLKKKKKSEMVGNRGRKQTAGKRDRQNTSKQAKGKSSKAVKARHRHTHIYMYTYTLKEEDKRLWDTAKAKSDAIMGWLADGT